MLVASLVLGRLDVASAQNADSFYYSNEAALTAGAMVAVAGDEGSAWYNPAGLGSLHRTRLNANGSVFGVRVRPVTRGLTSTLRGVSSSLDYGGTDFVATPTTASASFSLLPNLTLSGGVFHTSHDVRAAVGNDTVPGGEGRSLSQRIDTFAQQRKMHMGGAYGFDVGHGLRVGSGMFLVYSARDTSIDYLVGIDEGGKKEVVALSSSTGSAAWGLQSTYGVQWDVTKKLHLGAVFRFPELRFLVKGKITGAQVGAGSAGILYELTETKGKSGRIRWADPARVFFGIAYEPTDKIRLAIDADVSLALEEDTWGSRHDAMVRVRGGAIFKPLEVLHFGFGAFADPASERALPDVLGSIRADYYGGTGGIIFRTRLGSNAGSNAPVINFCAAVRYAVGVGEARTTVVGDKPAENASQPIVVHDIMPYIGSSVAF